MTGSTEAELRQEIARFEERLAEAEEALARDASRADATATRLGQIEAMLGIVPVGVVLSDSNGRIVLGNSEVEKMVRHPVLHSQGVDDYGEWISFHEDGRRVESREYPLSRVIRDREAHSQLDVRYQRGDGTSFWMRIIARPVHDAAGDRIGAAVAIVDIDNERQLAAQQQVLIGELNHRVKNAFSVVKSIVSQSLRKGEVPDGLRQTIDERLDAYAGAHAKLVGSKWDHASLHQIVEDIVVRIAQRRVVISGPDIDMPSRHALALSMAFYELTTNAVKYGALSAEGTVELTWRIVGKAGGRRLVFDWMERGGPPVVEPVTKGFGSSLTSRAVAMETEGQVETDFAAEGFRWRLDMPLGDNGPET